MFHLTNGKRMQFHFNEHQSLYELLTNSFALTIAQDLMND